jgi:NTP pyrophosphatase (non-canonical NTP hydrolase)
MDEKFHEIMSITQEECAECIQAISKIFRFGFDGQHPDKVISNKQQLEEEIGDLLAMIDLMKLNGIISDDNIDYAKLKKIEKLKKWSSILSK